MAGSQPGREASSCAVSASRGDGAGRVLGGLSGGIVNWLWGFSAQVTQLTDTDYAHTASQHPRNPQGEHPSLPNLLSCAALGTHHSPRGGEEREGELQLWDGETPTNRRNGHPGKQVDEDTPVRGQPWASLHSWGAPWTEVNWPLRSEPPGPLARAGLSGAA